MSDDEQMVSTESVLQKFKYMSKSELSSIASQKWVEPQVTIVVDKAPHRSISVPRTDSRLNIAYQCRRHHMLFLRGF